MQKFIRTRISCLALIVAVAVAIAVALSWGRLFKPARIGADAYPPAGRPNAALDPDIARGRNDFAVSLFQNLVAAQPDRNVFVSPASVSLAMSLVHAGASGQTRDAIAEGLGFSGRSDVHQANADLHASLVKADPYVRLAIANSLWIQQGLTANPQFLEVCDRYYDAAVTPVDLSSPAGIAEINNWISEATLGDVTRALSPSDVTLDTVGFLVNAIHFKGIWKTKFDPSDTHSGRFTRADGSIKQVDMMRQHETELEFAYEEDFSAVRLPYGNDRMALYVIVPDEDNSLPALCEAIDASLWDDWDSTCVAVEDAVGLPRVDIAFEASLKDALTDLGMGGAFYPATADLSEMLPPDVDAPLWLEDVKHHALLEIDEEGTTAAGVSIPAIGCAKASGVYADRPFLVAVRDDLTHTLLFLGAINDP